MKKSSILFKFILCFLLVTCTFFVIDNVFNIRQAEAANWGKELIDSGRRSLYGNPGTTPYNRTYSHNPNTGNFIVSNPGPANGGGTFYLVKPDGTLEQFWFWADYDGSRNYWYREYRIYRKVIVNSNPTITVTSLDNQLVAPEPELNEFTIEGFVQDVDNDTVNLTADFEGITKTATLPYTAVARPFAFNFTIPDEISHGVHAVTITAEDGNGGISTKTQSVTVKNRIKNNAYVLVNQPVFYDTIYEDPENDIFFKEQFKFTHNPRHFDNSTGVLSDSGVWRDIPYYSFADEIGRAHV